MPHSHSRRSSSPREQHLSQGDSFHSSKATPSLSTSSFSHSRGVARPAADLERVVLLRGFYWRSSVADIRRICEQDFGPVRVVLLYQGNLYPEAFVDFVHRRHAAQCLLCWTNPTRIYREKEGFVEGLSYIRWAFGVTAHSYKPPMNDKDWAKAWEERGRIERGEKPKEILGPRWKQTSARKEADGHTPKQYHRGFLSKHPPASGWKRQPQNFGNSGSAQTQNCQPSPLTADTGVVGDTSMETETVFTGATLVDSPASYSRDGMPTINIDDFLEEILEDSDLAVLSRAKAALQRATQKFMDTVDELDALTYNRCASAGVEEFDTRYSGSSRTGIGGAAGGQSSIGLVEALFRVQRIIELDLRV